MRRLMSVCKITAVLIPVGLVLMGRYNNAAAWVIFLAVAVLAISSTCENVFGRERRAN